jgi:type III restriction enzyme
LQAPERAGDDADEKRQVGHLWEQSSGGRCLYLWTMDRDDQGHDVFQQLAQKLQ